MVNATCTQCGQQNPEGSRFCNRCGARFVDDATLMRTTAVAAPVTKERMDVGEQLVFVLRPTMVFVIVRYVLAATVTAAAVTLYLYLDKLYPRQIPWWIVLVVAAVAFVFPFYHHILRQREIYTLTNRRIEFTYGILAKIRRNIPLSKVQDVTVTRSALERLLGIGDIVIDSAAESGKIPLRNVRDPEKHADLILRQIEHH